MADPRQTVLLGTVALEPNRWSSIDPRGQPTIELGHWMDEIAVAGFDGIEIWEKHLTQAAPNDARAILDHRLPTTVFNTYASFDDDEPGRRDVAAAWASRAQSKGVKFNVGNDPQQQGAYAERLAAWLDQLPSPTAALCECHHGISIAEDPLVAAAIFDAAGPAARVQAIVHTHEEPDHLKARFDAYGDRISHVHVNFLDFEHGGTPQLIDIREELETKVALLQSLGFSGRWTIEFTHGLLTDNDEPGYLLARATEDLEVLREALL